MIQTWFKIFFRNSKKNWLNMSINMLGLTLGFAGLLVVLLYLNDEQSYNVTNPEKNEIYRVLHKMARNTEVVPISNSLEGSTYKEEIPEIKDFYLSSGWYSNTLVKVKGKDYFSNAILQGSPNFFEFFPFEIIEGSVSKFKEVRNHIAISQEQAIAFFGNDSAIGKTIEFSNRTFVVTTVYKIVGKHYFMPNFVIQYSEIQQLDRMGWGGLRYNLFVKTTKEATIKAITKKALAVWHENYVLPVSKELSITPEKLIKERGITPVFESIEDIRLKTDASWMGSNSGPEGEGNYQLILIMLSLSILLIIISCVNFINLSIASSSQRAKSVGVKKTLGLSKMTLARQYALEIVLQGVMSFVFSLLLVELILPSFNDFTNKDISLFNISLLSKITLLVFIVSAVIGSIPAIYLSKFKAIEVLKGNTSRSKKGVFARNVMLGLQFLISGFFLTGSIIINQQVNFMMHKDLGFNGDQVVTISANNRNQYKNYLIAKKELIKHPNIDAVTSSSSLIGSRPNALAMVYYKDLTLRPVSFNTIDYNFLDVMDIKILKGRDFKEEFASDTLKNVLINETLAKKLNIYENPIGKEIKVPVGRNLRETLRVIGMVKDYNIQGLDTEILPGTYRHWNTSVFAKRMFSTIQFKIKPTNITETLNFIENYWKENIEQGYPFNPVFVNERFARTYKEYEDQQTIFFVLTLLVILVSLLGLFGLASLTIQQRLKEVAIRKTLGSSVKEIMFELIKSFLKITLIASVILIPIAYYFVQSWLDNFAYRIETPIWPFIVTPITLTVLVFIIVGLKAFNATKIDLIKYLKYD
jgi:putative ABC transport system permease protein